MANKDPENAWEYADWLLASNRLTLEEYNKLYGFLFQLEDEVIDSVYDIL